MKIREFRLSLGISQSMFSEMVGVSVGAVRDWEQERKKPDRRSRIALERAGFDLAEYDKEQKK